MEKKKLALYALGAAAVSAVTAIVTTAVIERTRKPHAILLTGNLGSVLDNLAAMFDTHNEEPKQDTETDTEDFEEESCECDCEQCRAEREAKTMEE